MDRKEKIAMVILIGGLIIGVLAIDFLITSGLIAVICWAFKLTFSWRVTIGIYAIIAILHGIFAAARNTNSK